MKQSSSRQKMKKMYLENAAHSSLLSNNDIISKIAGT